MALRKYIPYGRLQCESCKDENYLLGFFIEFWADNNNNNNEQFIQHDMSATICRQVT